jgi:hypothetical protein
VRAPPGTHPHVEVKLFECGRPSPTGDIQQGNTDVISTGHRGSLNRSLDSILCLQEMIILLQELLDFIRESRRLAHCSL